MSAASPNIIGFKPPDETWKKHKAVWDACEAAGIDAPPETRKFFNYESPDDAGVEVKLYNLFDWGKNKEGPVHECVKRWEAEMCDGFEVEVAKIPKDIKVLRFYISY